MLQAMRNTTVLLGRVGSSSNLQQPQEQQQQKKLSTEQADVAATGDENSQSGSNSSNNNNAQRKQSMTIDTQQARHGPATAVLTPSSMSAPHNGTANKISSGGTNASTTSSAAANNNNNSEDASSSFSSQRPPTPECDYDTNPTELYLFVQKKEWDNAIQRCAVSPGEAATWVSRKERDGKLRWRLLPLHAAIIFRAPEKAIEALLCAYPPGAQCKDDQGMLPIHLAFRNGSTEGVVNLLLVAYPQSIHVKDRKGRIPLVLAQASSSPNKDAFIKALERGPSYYAVAAAATKRASVEAEQKAIYDAKLSQAREEARKEVEAVRQAAEEERRDLEIKIDELETELAKTQETSQVLVDHVNSLEAQLSSRSDTERFLATKIAALDSSLKDAHAVKQSVEADFRSQNAALQDENYDLHSRIETLEKELKAAKDTIVLRDRTIGEQKSDSHDKKRKMEDLVRSLEIECANSRANAAVLEAQLKKKVETEHTLASQVSELAAKLAESAQASSTATSTYVHRVEVLEEEKIEYKAKIEELTGKLSNVARALDAMALEQERIVRAAAAHEETMARAAAAQEQILADTRRQEEFMLEAAREREQIAFLLSRQAEEMERSAKERQRIASAVKRQEEDMDLVKKERQALVDSVSRQRISMRELAGKELAGIPKVMANKDNKTNSNGGVGSSSLEDDDDDEYHNGQIEAVYSWPRNYRSTHSKDDSNGDDGDNYHQQKQETEESYDAKHYGHNFNHDYDDDDDVLGGQEMTLEEKASIESWAVEAKQSIDDHARTMEYLRRVTSQDDEDEEEGGDKNDKENDVPESTTKNNHDDNEKLDILAELSKKFKSFGEVNKKKSYEELDWVPDIPPLSSAESSNSLVVPDDIRAEVEEAIRNATSGGATSSLAGEDVSLNVYSDENQYHFNNKSSIEEEQQENGEDEGEGINTVWNSPSYYYQQQGLEGPRFTYSADDHRVEGNKVHGGGASSLKAADMRSVVSGPGGY